MWLDESCTGEEDAEMVAERRALRGLPQLAAGKHSGPEQGACLMEYVSVLAGQRFTDRPRCTPAAVAVVARRVNDAVGESARHRLVRWAPELITGRRDGLDDAVVLCCTATGLVAAPQDRHLMALQRRARWRLRHSWLRWLRLPAQAVVHEAFIAASAALATLPPDERDERLTGLLADVVSAARAPSAVPLTAAPANGTANPATVRR
jgi:hypothetical protein